MSENKDVYQHFPYVLGQKAEILYKGNWCAGRIVNGYRFRDGIVTIETEDGQKIWVGEQRKELYRQVEEGGPGMCRKVHLYILHGAWSDKDNDVLNIIVISDEIDTPTRILKGIVEAKAVEYYHPEHWNVKESIGERSYEISDDNGGYARFYIAEIDLKLSAETMRRLAIETEKEDRTRDVKEFIQGMYEGDEIPAWKYEYVRRKPEVLEQILQKMDKAESCNTAYNSTLDYAVNAVIKGIDLTSGILEELWDMFGDVAIDDDDRIEEDFLEFPEGEDRFEVWRWFDKEYSDGVIGLISRARDRKAAKDE